jgi:response regulator RpfG family c-di-GMP phosphodiesterase
METTMSRSGLKPVHWGQHCGGPELAAAVRARVLLVDDEVPVRRGLRRILEGAGYAVCEAGALAAASQALDDGAVDVVVLDLGLAGESGLSLLTHPRFVAGDAVAVVHTASRDRQSMKRALAGGASSYLLKSADTFSLEAQIEAALEQLRVRRESSEHRRSLEDSLRDAAQCWWELPRDIALNFCTAWDLRHVETGAHVRRIAAYTEALATAVGFSAADAANLGDVAILHDIGKLVIPDAILTKPGSLTAEEICIMRLHASEGARLLAGIRHPFFERAAMVALRHHERWDGGGYPDGLVGTACPLDARIVALVDVYDALGTKRCYKPAWEESRIVEYMQAQRGKQFEARLVDGILDCLPRLRHLAAEIPESNAKLRASAQAVT